MARTLKSHVNTCDISVEFCDISLLAQEIFKAK
jgi:hypothetical protein